MPRLRIPGAMYPHSPIRIHGVILCEAQGQLYLYLSLQPAAQCILGVALVAPDIVTFILKGLYEDDQLAALHPTLPADSCFLLQLLHISSEFLKLYHMVT
jgi:hypothetical protein